MQNFPPVRRMVKSSLVVAAFKRQERRTSASRICVIGRRKKAGRHHASGPSSEGTLRGALVEEALEDLALFCLGAQAVQGSGTFPTCMEPSVPMVMRCTEPAGAAEDSVTLSGLWHAGASGFGEDDAFSVFLGASAGVDVCFSTGLDAVADVAGAESGAGPGAGSGVEWGACGRSGSRWGASSTAGFVAGSCCAWLSSFAPHDQQKRALSSSEAPHCEQNIAASRTKVMKPVTSR